MNIAFRVDGSSNIGMGHIIRCLALAKKLKQDKRVENITFITKENNSVKSYIKDIKTIFIDENLSYDLEIKTVKKNVKENDIDILITDSYGIDQSYLIEMKKVIDKLVSISHKPLFSYPSDIVINGNIYALELNYESLYGDTEFLLGTDYTLMRDEFQDLSDKKINEEVENIMVTVGGSDILNLTPKIIKAINRLDENELTIDVVIGAGFDNIPAIIKEVEISSYEIRLHFNVNRMSDLMINSDIAVSAGGSTLYELAASGVPAVVMLQAENQRSVAEVMAEAGCVVNLGFGDEVDLFNLTDKIESLIGDFDVRRKMSDLGQNLIDGKGVDNCIDVILN